MIQVTKSKLALMYDCPFKVKFYIEGAEQAYTKALDDGILFHTIREKVEINREKITDIIDYQCEINLTDNKTKSMLSKMITKYFSSDLPAMVGEEKKLTATYNENVELVGKIDDRTIKSGAIVEFKTRAVGKILTKEQLLSDWKTVIEIAMYYTLVKLTENKDCPVLYVQIEKSNNPRIRADVLEIKEYHLELLDEAIKEYYNLLNSNQYERTLSYKCNYCQYRNHCFNS